MAPKPSFRNHYARICLNLLPKEVNNSVLRYVVSFGTHSSHMFLVYVNIHVIRSSEI